MAQQEKTRLELETLEYIREATIHETQYWAWMEEKAKAEARRAQLLLAKEESQMATA